MTLNQCNTRIRSHWLLVLVFVIIHITIPHQSTAKISIDTTATTIDTTATNKPTELDTLCDLLKRSPIQWKIPIDTTFITYVKKEIDDDVATQNKIGKKFKLSFRGDETKHQNRFTTSTQAVIQKGTYPREIRFTAHSDVTFENNELRENVTTLLMNYDYHFNRYVEGYGFIERFTDNYMGIDERYEIGVGFMVYAPYICRIKQEMKKIHNVQKLPVKELENWADTSTTLQEQEQGILRKFVRNVKRTKNSVEKKAAKLTLGVAFTIFKELESTNPFKYTLVDKETQTEIDTTFNFSPSHLYRGVIRPTIIWRINEQLEIVGLCYFKFAIFNGNTKIKGERDWRSDLFVSTRLKLSKDKPFHEGVSITLDVENRFDNFPLPLIPESMIENGLEAIPVTEEKNHLIVNLGIEVMW